jgi:hypothetical protein
MNDNSFLMCLVNAAWNIIAGGSVFAVILFAIWNIYSCGCFFVGNRKWQLVLRFLLGVFLFVLVLAFLDWTAVNKIKFASFPTVYHYFCPTNQPTLSIESSTL